jgi:hypothetical protein
MSEKFRCSRSVHVPGQWRPGQCSRLAVATEGGNHYCKQHMPSVEAARYAARRAKWYAEAKADAAARAKAQRITGATACIIQAARAAAAQKGSWDAVADAVTELDAAEAPPHD